MLDVNKFKYTIFLNEAIQKEKSYRAIKNRGLAKNDRLSGIDKLTLLRALRSIKKFMIGLQKGDDRDKQIYRQFCLERDYIRELEKDKLRTKIKKILKQPIGGAYNLSEIGKVLNVSRERARQIEASAHKILRHPVAARALKSYQEN